MALNACSTFLDDGEGPMRGACDDLRSERQMSNCMHEAD
jgi:hypothetical protein